MKKKKVVKKREIRKVKEQIHQIAPYADNVKINVIQMMNGAYSALIKVHLPPKRTLVAKKVDDDFKKVLEKSRLAIIKQVKKAKRRGWKGTRKTAKGSYFDIDNIKSI